MRVVTSVLLVILLFPIVALAFFNPSRVLVPEVFGTRCDQQNFCVDNAQKRLAAVELYSQSRRYLENRRGLKIGDPKIIFCSTDMCKDRFGLKNRAGYTAGTWGIVILPRGWTDYYVSHELIHYWQASNFGNLVLLRSDKQWLIEGMAYSLSNDPRETLSEPFEENRLKFRKWRQGNSDMSLLETVGKAL